MGTKDFNKANQVLQILNQLRISLGENELVMDETLTDAAMQRAAECAIYYSHTRPDGMSCFSAMPEDAGAAGENIACGQLSAVEVMDQWTNSSGHYANMTNQTYARVGIGCFIYNERCFWVQIFAEGSAHVSQKTGTEESLVSIAARQEYLNLSVEVPPNIWQKDGTLETDKYYYFYLVNTNKGYPCFKCAVNQDDVKMESDHPEIIYYDQQIDGMSAVGEGAVKITVTSRQDPRLTASRTITFTKTLSNIPEIQNPQQNSTFYPQQNSTYNPQEQTQNPAETQNDQKTAEDLSVKKTAASKINRLQSKSKRP